MAKKKAGNAALWVIILLLIVGLAGFGATSFSGSVRNVATVGDVEIDVNEYARAVETQVRNFQRATGQQLSFQQARTIGLDRAALSQLISGAALENEAGELGISAGDVAVSEEIVASPAFQGAGGTFDRGIYELALRQNGTDVPAFEERVRADIATGILRSAVGSGVRTPDVFSTTLFLYARETRDATWARLGADDLTEPLPEPTEEQLTAYYEANPADFTRPGMLEGAVLRSPHAHARIRAIDTARAHTLPGVKAIVTSQDFKDQPSEFVPAGEMLINYRDVVRNVMAREKVLYEGHAVAAVAAPCSSSSSAACCWAWPPSAWCR